MRLLIRIIMAASLIMAAAAQAASLTEAHGERQAANERAASYEAREARLKNTLDRDEKTWRRLSASICTGCGSPPPPLEITRTKPLYLPPRLEADTGTPDAQKTASTSATQPVSSQRTGLQQDRKGRTRVVRSTRSSVRSTAQAQRYARYARLRMIRDQKRLALLQTQKPKSLSLPTRREAATQTPDTEKTAATSATQPVSIQSTALQEHREGRTHVVPSTRSSVRSAARAQRYARYERLRMIRSQRHLALLQMRKQRQAHALLASRARHHTHHMKLAARSLQSPFRLLFSGWSAMWTRLAAGFPRHVRQDQQAGSWRRR